MAGLLTAEQILIDTIVNWASTDCEEFPCGLAVWRYACAISGIDAPALPEHQTTRAMVGLLRDQGGLEQYARTLITALGWQEVPDPQRGDVGVIDLPGSGLTCAICLGALWMAKGRCFVVTVRATPLAAWSFRKCHRQSQH